jgi:hypothetical protein
LGFGVIGELLLPSFNSIAVASGSDVFDDTIFAPVSSLDVITSVTLFPTIELETFEARFLQTPAGVIPEPTALIVWALLGLTGLGFSYWRRKREAA